MSMESSNSFQNSEGTLIHVRRWPATKAKAQVVIAHGLGEHSGRYQAIAEFLTQRGYDCHALDHQGHGRSGGQPGHITDFGIYVDTLADFITELKSADTSRPCFLIGHSMGGVIAANLLLDHPELVDACVLSGPALATDDTIGTVQKALLHLVARLAPSLRIFSVDPALVCSDPEVVKAYIDDPLVLSGKGSAKLVTEILGAGQRALSQSQRIQTPMLLLHGEDDALAHPDGSRRMHRGISSTDKDLVMYPGLHHEIFNEPSKYEIYQRVTDWLDARL